MGTSPSATLTSAENRFDSTIDFVAEQIWAPQQRAESVPMKYQIPTRRIISDASSTRAMIAEGWRSGDVPNRRLPGPP